MLRTTMAMLLAAGLASTAAAQSAPESRTVAFKGNDGANLGEATITATPKGVLLRVAVKGLTPGWHGIHLHAKGDCGDAKFQNAGGHVHGGGGQVIHGLLNPQANDSGDLPNLYAAADGTAVAEFHTTLVGLTGTERPALLHADGSAIVIHANPDDHHSQPIGGAGDRVACAVIK